MIRVERRLAQPRWLAVVVPVGSLVVAFGVMAVVLAREFHGDPRVLVVASPTRGLDVAAIETVHRYLREAASSGVGILLISEDLDEILALADRVAVIFEGSIVGERDADEATVEEVGLLMAGGEAE